MGFEIFKHEANFIKRQLTHPCARPWYIWVETFLPAFIKLLITVNLFDVEDAIRSHGKKISGPSKGRTGKRHTPRIKTQGRLLVPERWQQRGLRTLLVVTQPLELIGLTWLIFSSVDQFFYDWQTLLDLSDFCKNPIQSGPLQVSRGPGTVSIVESFVPVIMPITDQDRASWNPGLLSVDLPEGIYSAVFALTVIGPIGGVNNVLIRLRTPGSLGADVTVSDPLALTQGEEGSLVVRHDFFYPIIGGGTLTWEVGGETIPAGIETIKGRVVAQRTG